MKIIILKIIGRVIATGSLGLVVSVSQAAPLIPFSNGNVADANDVNTNFTELETRINTISLTPGPTGSQGPAGTNGLDGAQGAGGLDGTTGPQGPQGLSGVNGLDGAPGVDGINGAPGADGLDGATGPQGPQGLAGVNGIDGAPGVDGIDGAPGTNGLDGATGPQGPAGSGESSADNAPISVDCSTQSLQAAIEAAPLHGRTLITISGACSDDIYVRRNGITIQGFTGPGTDSITGNASGFSSDPADNYNLPAAAGALVQKNLEAAVGVVGRVGVRLENLTIDSGSNASAVKAERNSSLRLANVTLIGGPNGFGLHASDSNLIISGTTITGDGTGPNTVPGAGAAVLAEMNSVIEIRDNNTFTGGDGDTRAFMTISNTSVNLTGGSNIFNAGLPVGLDDEPSSLDLNINSTLTQLTSGTGNQINGDFNLFAGSRMFLSNVVINSDVVELVESSHLSLESESSGDIVFNTSIIFLDQRSTLELSEGGTGSGVSINSGGVAGTMSLYSSIASNRGGSLINMDVQLFSGSSMDGGENSKIGGNLEVRGFSTYEATGQVGSSVLGTVTCFKGEAFDFTAGVATPLGSCL